MSGKSTIYAFLGVGLLTTLCFVVMPVMFSVSLSFYRMESFVGAPEWVGLYNYTSVLSDFEFWRALASGSIYALLSIVLQLVLGIGLALILNQSFPGRGLVRGVSILPYLLPTVIVVLTFKWMVDGSVGVITNLLEAFGLPEVRWFETPHAAMMSNVLVSVWMWTPFVTTCFLAGLQTVPDSLYEAARVDGTNAWQRFIHVTLPMLKPILTVVILLRGIWMFNKFDVIWLMTKGGPLGSTENLAVLSYRRAFTQFDVGGGAAVATLSFLILSLAIFLYFRAFPLETD
ncbi:carbohydrate ABC transporter permease [Ancylobacter polymorphus]|uniref:Sugar ABC transporter permease n=1 Tax=Ancylobacter polymorphus TaxID=223390 RepID=A0A9E7A371_9HYPH|nr:sugar ABC transporter permease [Ancylobacter polymorphus]UOK71878.1 sugar ABC transporter permease [Ancylobacter polymorphus]